MTKNKRILIIDDDADARLALDIRLRSRGYETYFAVDGVSAIAETRNCSPDLILLDLKMPAGDGYAVIEHLHANPHWACIPLVVISGLDPEVNRERARRAGAQAYLQKPVRKEALLQVMYKLLGREEQPTTYSEA